MRATRVGHRRVGPDSSLSSVSGSVSTESDAASEWDAASPLMSSPPSSATISSSGVSGAMVSVPAMAIVCHRFQCAWVLSWNEFDVGHLGRVAHHLDADAHPPRSRLLLGRLGSARCYCQGDER